VRFLSPRVRYRPHTASPDLSIARPPSTRLVRPSPVLCIRSPTPTTTLVAVCHVVPITCTPRDKQTRFSKRNKNKRKNKNKTIPDSNSNIVKSMTYHTNQVTDHLVSQLISVVGCADLITSAEGGNVTPSLSSGCDVGWSP
jgi:hypothetical protein